MTYFRILLKTKINLTLETMGNKEIREVFEFLEENRKSLTQYQLEFIKSLKKYYKWKGHLTERQIECLVGLREYIMAPAER